MHEHVNLKPPSNMHAIKITGYASAFYASYQPLSSIWMYCDCFKKN